LPRAKPCDRDDAIPIAAMGRPIPVVIKDDAPSSRLVSAELSKGDVRKRLHAIALWHTRSNADAEDLVADAFVRVLDPEDRPWDPSKRGFLVHMSFVMQLCWAHQSRRLRFRNEVSDEGVAQESTSSDAAPVDDEVDRTRTLEVRRELGERVFARLEDPLTRKVFKLGAEEDLKPAVQAERLKCSVDAIHAAYKQITYHGRVVLEEWNESEKRRMKELRERAMSPDEERAP
jgi:DNA-directed RNA polymerase specialized sigma24 family protein